VTRQSLGPDDPLRHWGDAVLPVEDQGVASRRRGPAVERLAAIIREEAEHRSRARRRYRLAGGLSAAAALALGVGFAWRHHASPSAAQAAAHFRAVSGSVTALHHGAPRASTDDVLDAEDVLTTGADAAARVGLTGGVALHVGSHVRLALGPRTADAAAPDFVRLDEGAVTFDVPKLGAGHSFSVETPDARVTVHGTSFEVTVDHARTRVVVREGLVSVVHDSRETFVGAGESWPAPRASAAVDAPPAPGAGVAPIPAQTPAPTGAAPDGSRTAARRGASQPAASPIRPTATMEVAATGPREIAATGPREIAATGPREIAATGTLGEENRLLAAAKDARRRGDDRGAVRLLDDLLAHFPASALAQEARVERFRALDHAGDHGAAARAARSYLAEERDGFARDEARQLALDPAPAAPAPR
jgi:ferric-dicitrate binding protein FerR (iron transport regulator)